MMSACSAASASEKMGELGVRKRKTQKAKKLRTTIRKEERQEKKIFPKNASPSHQK